MPHIFHPSILRKYDIRGRVGETLMESDIFAAGQCFGHIAQENKIQTVAVCRDGRLSSPEFEQALIEGITSQGINVVTIGLGPSPLLYYAVKEDPTLGGGIMITGSHNDRRYNGLKMLLKDRPIWGSDIQDFPKRVAGLSSSPTKGTVQQKSFDDAYIKRLVQDLDLSKSLKIVWDCGNGAAGPIVSKLTQMLPGKHILLYDKVDGTFPNHHPDPTVLSNMQDLKEAVLANDADIGIGFDGDGDRIGVIGKSGMMLNGDELMVLYGRDVLNKHPSATILVDVKTSRFVLEDLKKHGGNPRLSATGHSSIKAMMKETGALLAGELSGHIFFADDYYGFDDAIYASLRLLKILSKEQKDIEALLSDLPKTYKTPEIGVPCGDADKFELVENLKKSMTLEEGATLITLDGIRVEYNDGWWLIRASNTESILTIRAEATTSVRLDEFMQKIQSLLGDALNPHVAS
jgi:phosphomannomutase